MISSRSPNIMFCSLCSWVPCAVEWGHSVQTTTPNINPLVVHTTSPASRESLQPSHSQPMDLQVLPRVDGYLSWQGDASPSLPPSPIHPPVPWFFEVSFQYLYTYLSLLNLHFPDTWAFYETPLFVVENFRNSLLKLNGLEVMKPSLPHHQREEEFQALRKNLEEPKPVQN